LHASTSIPHHAAPDRPDGLASAHVIEPTEGAPESSEATLAQLEATTQKLQFENLELRLRLQRRKSRWAFERKLLAMAGLGLLLVGVMVGLLLGLVVGSTRYVG
jgi:hypothetical protein